MDSSFEWDENKNLVNEEKHHIRFEEAQYAFFDPKRIIFEDVDHSQQEKRYYCIGKVDNNICTVGFTYRKEKIRIFGAGYWRKERNIYETINKNKII